MYAGSKIYFLPPFRVCPCRVCFLSFRPVPFATPQTRAVRFGEAVKEDAEPLLLMINSCKPEKQKYAEDILKTFLLAIE
jgi:hypothetical protein